MKKVIKNRVYDTETAKICAEYAPNPYRSDFHYFCETLYHKKTGEFFLHGEGNAASKYKCEVSLNEWCGGEKIIPMTYEEAQAWAEEHMDGDDYISIFGEPEENDETGQLAIRISAAKLTKLRQTAGKRGLTLVELVESMIDDL